MAQDLFSSSTRICFRHAIDPEPVVDALVCGGDNLEWNALLYQGASLAPNYQCILINSIGEGVAESDETTSLNFDVDTTANYYIHAYDGTCALSWGPKLITVPWMDLGEDIYVCDDENYQITPGQVSAELASAQDVNFDWIDNQSLTWGGPYPIITPDADPNPNTYSVTVTYTNSISLGCSLSDAFQIYRVECCDGNEVTLHNPDLEMLNDAINDVDPTTNGTIVISNETININGKLFINNHNLRLENCTLNMAEGSEIVVDRHLVLGLDGTLIQACGEKMWKGIRLLESATINNNGAPSEISDAEYAVTTRYRSRLVLDNFDEDAVSFDPYLIFKRNYISLFIPPSPTGALNDVELRLANLDFDADGVLNTPYLGQTNPVITGSKSFAGMVFNDVAGVIGLNNGVKNRIRYLGLNNGMILNNSTLMVTNSIFHDIQPDGTYAGSNGIGIHANGNGHVLSQRGLGAAAFVSSFDNCRTGISAAMMSLDIKNNRMTDVQTGISHLASWSRTVDISHNYINCSLRGIYSYNGNLSNTIHLHMNEIELDDPTGNTSSAGIMIDEKGIFGTADLQVFDNFVEVTSGGNGIALNSTKNSQVYDNDVNLYDEVNDVNGISLNSCLNANILSNEINGSSTSSNTQTAISVYATTFSHIDQNLTNATQIGLYFNEYCEATFMTCNDMFNHDYGTYVDHGGLFNHPHILAGNEWLGTITQGFEYSDALNYQIDFFTADDGTTEWPYTFTSLFFNDDVWVDCPIVPGPFPLNPVFDTLDYVISWRNLPMEEFEDEYNYMAKTNLYYKADLYPDSIPAESEIDSFYTANHNTTIVLFRSVDKRAATLFSIDSVQLHNVKTSDSLILVLFNEISFNDSLINSGVNANDSMILLEENNRRRESLYALVKLTYKLMSSIDSLNELYADSLSSENAIVSVSETIEVNQKIINSIFYATIAKGIFQFDSTQSVNIYSIAVQCPLAGGKAVSVARGMYRLINDTVFFMDSCSIPSPRMAQYNNNNEFNETYIYPNPANDEAALKYRLPDDINGECIIYDIVGREKIILPLSSKQNIKRFSCYNMNSGLYFYKIAAGNEFQSFGKFNVIK